MPFELPLFPLNTVLFPGMRLPLQIFEPRYKVMLAELLERGGEFGVLLIREGPEVGGEAETFDVGTTACFEEVQEAPDGRFFVTARGRRRFRLLQRLPSAPYPRGLVDFLPDLPLPDTPAVREAERNVRERFPVYFRAALELSGQWARDLELPARAEELPDFLGPWLQVEEAERQRLLAVVEPEARLSLLAETIATLAARLSEEVAEHRRRKYRWLGAEN